MADERWGQAAQRIQCPQKAQNEFLTASHRGSLSLGACLGLREGEGVGTSRKASCLTAPKWGAG